MPRSSRSNWITESYEEQLKEFSADQGVPRECVEVAFQEYCETFRESVVEETGRDVVRELAYEKLQWHPPTEDTTPC